ncbi:alpha/beta hydrolase [Comamonadaceae bacterium OH2545_COT-014]|nr:alpha/beta hydrolase [Comamonadaceae bacterium OH2545_COT-014]
MAFEAHPSSVRSYKKVSKRDAQAPSVLILPGWLGSGLGHWQTRWEARHGYQRVEQHDWQRPLRGDWTARLEDAVLAAPAPVLLAAHSLGCILTAWWAAHTRHADRVAGALLVAPPDIERADNRQKIPGWAPPARQRLPFAATVVASSDDPFGSLETASCLAADWGASFYSLGACGHINADSGLEDWDEGHALLLGLRGSQPPAAA